MGELQVRRIEVDGDLPAALLLTASTLDRGIIGGAAFPIVLVSSPVQLFMAKNTMMPLTATVRPKKATKIQGYHQPGARRFSVPVGRPCRFSADIDVFHCCSGT